MARVINIGQPQSAFCASEVLLSCVSTGNSRVSANSARGKKKVNVTRLGIDVSGYTKVAAPSFFASAHIKVLPTTTSFTITRIASERIMNGFLSRRRISSTAGTALLLSIVAISISCNSTSSNLSAPAASAATPLTAADVQQVVENASQSINVPSVVAVSDRAGNILAVFETTGAPTTAVGNFGASVDSRELAAALARTAALFSNDQAPLSSRTVRYIRGIHFPPGVTNAPNADLYGIENTNRGCPLNVAFNAGRSVPPATLINGSAPGLGIITGKADSMDSDPNAVNPGGVPLFKDGHAVGGVGVVSASAEIAEYAAFAGASQAGFLPTPAQLPPPGVVIVGGIALPFVNQTTIPAGVMPGAFSGSYIFGPVAGNLPPEGGLVAPTAGTAGLTQADVAGIIGNAVATAELTRAVIRLPQGSRTRMTIAVTDLDGTILGLHRLPDATVFSVDVAVAKARNVVYFSGPSTPADLPGVPSSTAV